MYVKMYIYVLHVYVCTGLYALYVYVYVFHVCMCYMYLYNLCICSLLVMIPQYIRCVCMHVFNIINVCMFCM